MEEADRAGAATVRAQLATGWLDHAAFGAALLGVPPIDRDAWLDLVLGLGELPDDGPALPRDGVPYLPCAVEVLLRVVEAAHIGPADVFVDLGGGLGRAAALVHLLTGASGISLEIQPHLVAAARELAARLPSARLACVEGDAAQLAGHLPIGSVFFLYCPFSGPRLAKVLAELETLVRARTIRVCCVDLPLPSCPWLTLESTPAQGLAIYRGDRTRPG